MGGRHSRNKGQRWEREVARIFREHFPFLDTKRGFQTRGAEQCDVTGVPGLWIECKHGKCPNPRAALKQAEKDKTQMTYSVAVIKDDRCRPFVAMHLDEFMSVIAPWVKESQCHLTKPMTETAESEQAKCGKHSAGTRSYITESSETEGVKNT